MFSDLLVIGGGKQKEALLTKFHVPELLLKAGLPVPFDSLEATLLPAVQPLELQSGKEKAVGTPA